MAGSGEFRSIAGDSEMRQANVNANGFPGSRDGRHCLSIIARDRSVELAAGIAADGDRLDLTDDLPMHDAFYPADFLEDKCTNPPLAVGGKTASRTWPGCAYS
jgi:hypothetical protein